eukprot:6001638-Alexandrium_andersonii.AAC.1
MTDLGVDEAAKELTAKLNALQKKAGQHMGGAAAPPQKLFNAATQHVKACDQQVSAAQARLEAAKLAVKEAEDCLKEREAEQVKATALRDKAFRDLEKSVKGDAKEQQDQDVPKLPNPEVVLK